VNLLTDQTSLSAADRAGACRKRQRNRDDAPESNDTRMAFLRCSMSSPDDYRKCFNASLGERTSFSCRLNASLTIKNY